MSNLVKVIMWEPISATALLLIKGETHPWKHYQECSPQHKCKNKLEITEM